jgi:hypothetical protein
MRQYKSYTVVLSTRDIRTIISGLEKLRKLVAFDASMEKLYHYGSPHTIKALEEYDNLSDLITHLNDMLDTGERVELKPDNPWIQTSMLDVSGEGA